MSVRIIAVTSYYNPLRGQLRKRNYDVFRKYLGIPLLTVEWSSEANFELSEDDADFLIQVDGGDLLWQKERLLNIGLSWAQDAAYDVAVLLDCDIVFENEYWSDCIVAELKRKPFVQCFRSLRHLEFKNYLALSRKELGSMKVEREVTASSFLFLRGIRSPFPTVKNFIGPVVDNNPGVALAIDLRSIQSFSLYERNIVGGGDRVFMNAAHGSLEEYFRTRVVTQAHASDIQRWASSNLPGQNCVGHAQNIALHLWHGDLSARGYIERHNILAQLNYDPARDVATQSGGALSLVADAKELREKVGAYLKSRGDS